MGKMGRETPQCGLPRCGGLQAAGIRKRKKRKDLFSRQRREDERNEKTKQTK
jgi:hypothetical protein